MIKKQFYKSVIFESQLMTMTLLKIHGILVTVVHNLNILALKCNKTSCTGCDLRHIVLPNNCFIAFKDRITTQRDKIKNTNITFV